MITLYHANWTKLNYCRNGGTQYVSCCLRLGGWVRFIERDNAVYWETKQFDQFILLRKLIPVRNTQNTSIVGLWDFSIEIHTPDTYTHTHTLELRPDDTSEENNFSKPVAPN